MVAPHNTLEKNPDGIGRGASPVRVIQHIVDGAGKAGSVSASTDVATLLTQDLSEDVAAVTINNVSGNVIFTVQTELTQTMLTSPSAQDSRTPRTATNYAWTRYDCLRTQLPTSAYSNTFYCEVIHARSLSTNERRG